MKIWKMAFLAVVLIGSLFAITSADAQDLQRGEIRGFVYDSSHALVPGAKVTVSNSSTGYKREQVTDYREPTPLRSCCPGCLKSKRRPLDSPASR